MTKQFYDANDKKDQRRGLIYAISLHVALFLLLLAGLLNAPRNPSPVQIELWAEGDLQVEEEPGGDVNFDEVEEIDELDETSAMDEPAVNDEQTESEPTESETPETEDQPEPTTDDTDPVEQDTAQPDQSNQSQDLPPEKDPDIALAKAEKERQEREEEERRAREEAERKAKEEEERKAREEAERKAKEEEERKKAQLREAMQAAGREAAGIEGGTASRNQAGGGGDDGYSARLRSCIKPRVIFNSPPRRGNNNPTLQYEASLDGEGRVLGVTIVRSSGNRQFDEAVKKGIEKCSPLPTPPSGKFPNKFGGEYRMYD